MTEPQAAAPAAESSEGSKEYNFRRMQAKHDREMEEMRRRVEQAESMFKSLQNREPEEDDDDEPYISKSRLSKELSSVEKRLKSEFEKEKELTRKEIREREQASWLKTHKDFNDIMEHASKLVQVDPELAETILAMPDTFERQQLVYRNIKALGLHKPPEEAKPEDLTNNPKSLYYNPSGVGSSPFSRDADFSREGQKEAYKWMKDLQGRLRL